MKIYTGFDFSQDQCNIKNIILVLKNNFCIICTEIIMIKLSDHHKKLLVLHKIKYEYDIFH